MTDLDSDQFAVRAKATTELEQWSELAEAALRKALADQPSLEVRRRVQLLLERLDGPITSPERLRAMRAVEVLEHIDTPEARRLLEQLARGAPAALLTKEAKASLGRLVK
jgi:hypothetical protein